MSAENLRALPITQPKDSNHGEPTHTPGDDRRGGGLVGPEWVRWLRSQSSSTAAATVKADAPADAKGEVSYWNQFTGADERAGFDAVTSGFAKAYPSVTLKTESIPNADFMTKYTTAVQSNTGPQAVMVQNNRAADILAMNGLIDLKDSLEGWSGLSDFDDKVISPFIRDGKTYAVPAAMFVDWIYYRADWFADAGISEAPTTWTEFRDAAKKLTDTGKDRYGFGMRGGAGGAEMLIKLIRSYNGPLVDADGKPALAKDAVATALDEYTATYTKDKSVPLSAPNDSYNQIFQSFLTGRTGMICHHTGSTKSVIAALKPDSEVKAAPMPKTDQYLGWLQPLGNGLRSTDNVGASLAWLEYWGSKQAQIDFFNSTGYFPAATSAQTDPTVTSAPLVSAATAAVKVNVTPEFFPGYDGWQNQSVLVQMQSVLVGKTSVADAADIIMSDYTKSF